MFAGSFFSLLFSLFLRRKDNFAEKITLTVCLCLDVWHDSFWKNLISKFFWKMCFCLLATLMALLYLLFTRQNGMLPWFPNTLFLGASWLWLMEANRLAWPDKMSLPATSINICVIFLPGKWVVLHKVLSCVGALYSYLTTHLLYWL